MNLVSIAIVAVALSFSAQYQLVVQDKSFLSHDLSGTVEDPSGAPLSDAKVEIIACSSSDRRPKVLRSVQSGPDGRFRFARKLLVKEYCMQIGKDGFDQIRFSVVITETDRTMEVKLPVAT